MWGAIFPGQGSQHVGMGEFLFREFPQAKQRLEEASDALSLNFKKLCFEGSESDLALTHNTQPALLLVSTMTLDVLKSEFDFHPRFSSGHSVGEYAAFVGAGVLNFADAMKAVRVRGQAMQEAVPVGQGGMVAVMGPSPAEIKTLCEWAIKNSGQGPLEPANFNAPGQIVISGQQKCIDWLLANFKAEDVFGESKRIRLIPLKVSAPFHCSLMKPAEEKMRTVLERIDFKNAETPVVQNVPAEAMTEAPKLRENLILQISSPVRWVECIETLERSGVTRLVEVGSGKVLSGLVKKIAGDKLTTFNTTNLEELKNLEKEFH
ncbi:MAG: ACP S-malonyltransferase [Bdellovibrionales bacterium]|nr:ACP S-malonyltransferase [Bdellovibrionales bacterium]